MNRNLLEKVLSVLVVAVTSQAIGCGVRGDAGDCDSQRVMAGVADEHFGSSETVFLGSRIVHAQPVFRQDGIGLDGLERALAWQEAGLVTITGENRPIFSRERVKEHVGEAVDIHATEKGRTKGSLNSDVHVGEVLAAQLVEPALRVVSSRRHSTSTSDYCIVEGVIRRELTEDGRAVYAFLDKTVEAEMRFRAVFRFDPFEEGWQRLGWEEASGNDDFSDRFVERLIRGSEAF